MAKTRYRINVERKMQLMSGLITSLSCPLMASSNMILICVGSLRPGGHTYKTLGNLGCGDHVIHDKGRPHAAPVQAQLVREMDIQAMVQHNHLRPLPASAQQPPPPACTRGLLSESESGLHQTCSIGLLRILRDDHLKDGFRLSNAGLQHCSDITKWSTYSKLEPTKSASPQHAQQI